MRSLIEQTSFCYRAGAHVARKSFSMSITMRTGRCMFRKVSTSALLNRQRIQTGQLAITAFALRRKSRGNPFGINKPWQCAFIPMGGQQAHGKLIVAPGELLRSSAKCRMKITSAELGEQLQVLSGGPPAQSAQKLIAVGSNSSLRPKHHSGFAGLRTIPSTHSSGTGML
jgi:hypothetical protein